MSERKTYEERKADFEQRKSDKAERLRDAAERARTKSNQLYQESKSMTAGIPFGQPILVGHHSEKAHRRLLDRSWNKMGKSVQEDKKASYYEHRADNAESGAGGIKTEDPDAIAKLKSELAGMQESQEMMKAANKIVKSKKLSDDEKVAQLTELGIRGPHRLLKPDFAGRIGFASYSLSNNNANMRRVAQRIKDLEERETMDNTEKEYGDITVKVDFDDNRVRIEFPGKPSDEVRKKLKSNGFRWAPSMGAWQRQINRYSVELAHQIAQSEMEVV